MTEATEHAHYLCVYVYPRGISLVAQTVKRLPAMWETWDQFLGWKIPWRRKWQSTPALLPEKSHGQRSLIGYGPWGREESDTTERLHFTSLHFTSLCIPPMIKSCYLGNGIMNYFNFYIIILVSHFL